MHLLCSESLIRNTVSLGLLLIRMVFEPESDDCSTLLLAKHGNSQEQLECIEKQSYSTSSSRLSDILSRGRSFMRKYIHRSSIYGDVIVSNLRQTTQHFSQLLDIKLTSFGTNERAMLKLPKIRQVVDIFENTTRYKK